MKTTSALNTKFQTYARNCLFGVSASRVGQLTTVALMFALCVSMLVLPGVLPTAAPYWATLLMQLPLSAGALLTGLFLVWAVLSTAAELFIAGLGLALAVSVRK